MRVYQFEGRSIYDVTDLIGNVRQLCVETSASLPADRLQRIESMLSGVSEIINHARIVDTSKSSCNGKKTEVSSGVSD